MNNQLIDISGNELNLSISDKYNEIYNIPTAYVQTIINEINNDKIYQQIFNDINRKDLNILDIGGNIGLFSLYIYPYCSNILSVEPTPNHVDIFRDIKNKLGYDKIKIIQGAISDISGTTKFFINKTNSTMNTLRYVSDIGYDDSIDVSTYTMSDLIKISNFDTVDFVKLDIEGGEEKVIFSEDFKESSKLINSIYVEVHQGLGINLNNIISRLSSIGFTNIFLTPYSANQGVYAKKQ